MGAGGILKRHMLAEYLNTTPGEDSETWSLMGTGFTEANEDVNAQTDSKKYINNASATGSVKSYEWAKPFTTDIIEAEESVEYICDIGRLLKTGVDAETEHITVHLNKKAGEEANTYYARKIGVAVAVSSFSDNDGEMQCEGDLLGRGDIVKGTFNTKTKTFTPTEDA
jgi:hypothetical protein